MLYKELEELINKGDLREGDKVWICDYRLNDSPLEKPIRHVAPIEVIISNNNTLPKNKTVYYSSYHFRGITKKGTPSSKIIAPYDNTGYRTYTGVSLNIFLDEIECKKHYRKQCEEIKETIEDTKDSYIRTLEDIMSSVNQEIIEHC